MVEDRGDAAHGGSIDALSVQVRETESWVRVRAAMRCTGPARVMGRGPAAVLPSRAGSTRRAQPPQQQDESDAAEGSDRADRGIR